MNCNDTEIIQIYNDLIELLQHFENYIIEYKKIGHVVISNCWNVQSEAFNILLVITNRRDAMLITPFDISESIHDSNDTTTQHKSLDTNKNSNLQQEIDNIMHERYIGLKNLIQNKFKLNSIDLLFRDTRAWIYNKSIQKEMDEKKETQDIYDVLRYGCRMPGLNKVAVKATYKHNGVSFIGIVNKKVDFDHIRYLYDCLEKFKSLAKILNQKVSLDITFL